MTHEMSTIERAFQLAQECKSVDEIKAKLKAGGYSNVDAHLSGKSIRADLREQLNPKSFGTSKRRA